MRKLLKLLKIIGLAMLALMAVLSAMGLHTHLKNNNLWFYATGTKDKAFLDSTWKMSYKEVERANNTILGMYEDPFVALGEPAITNPKRFTEYIQYNLFLWGFPAEVHYTFFDNMLYEYYITLAVYDVEMPYKEILQTLQSQFGEGKVDDERKDLVSWRDWEAKNQKVACWMGKVDGKANEYYVSVRSTYQPVLKLIEDTAKGEKKKYF
jgi:hypothetical protein